MMKRLTAFLAAVLCAATCWGQAIDLGLGITSTGGVQQAYTQYSPGINGNPLAPLFAHGDGGLGDATFLSGVDGPVQFPRQPVVVKATNGDLLAFCQVHENSTSSTGDGGISAIQMRRSTNRGVTWGAPQIIYHETNYVRGVTWINFGVVVVNELTDRIHVLFTHTQNGNAATPPVPPDQADIDAYWTYSDDHGATWAAATDISAGVKKTGGTTAPYGKADEEWGWYIFGPSKGIQIKRGDHAGRLIAPADHRYSRGTEVGSADMGSAASNESWSHVCYCDDDETWLLGGGVDETDTANDYTNEFSVCEYGTDGELFGWIRKVSGTGSGYKCSTRSLDGGATWEDITINDGTGGTTNLASSSTQGCVESMPNGDIYAMFVGDSAIRANVSIAKSTDGGLTFPTRRILDYRLSAYGALCAVDSGSLFAAWESVPHVTDHTSASYNPCQYILARRLPTSWVTNSSYDDFDWCFSDFIGTPTAQQALGLSIKDRGTTKQAHARLLTGGTGSANGLTTSGSALAVTLAERTYNGATQAALPGPCDIDKSKDWHIELVGFATTDATAGVRRIGDTRNGTSAAGWNFNITNSSNVPQFVLSDGTNSATVTGASAVNDGTARNIRVSYTASNTSLQLYINGVASGSSASTSALTNSINSVSSAVLGGLGSGSAYLPYTLKRLRITRGTRTDFLDGTETRQTLEQFYNYAVTAPATLPTSAATAKLFALATYDGGWHVGLDHYGGWDKGAMPLLAGTGYQSYRDLRAGLFFQAQSQNQGMHWGSDDYFGPHHRLSYSSTSANGALRISSANLGTLIDALQSTGVFSLVMCFKMEADTGANQILLSNNNGNTTDPGINVLWQRSTGLISLRIVGNNSVPSGVNIINETVAGTTVAAGDRCFLAITGSGFGAKAKVYLGKYTSGRTAPTLGAAIDTSANLTDPGGTPPYASSQPFAIGALSNGTGSAFNGSMKNVAIWTGETLTAQEIQNWCTFGAAY